MINSIRVEGITKKYNGTNVVSDISFEVKSGEFIGLLGPNGAGKTTTLEIIEGLREADAGEVFYDDQSIRFARVLQRIKCFIGIQLEQCNYFEKLYLGEVVRLFATFYGIKISVEKTEKILTEFELPVKKFYHHLSAGQKKRFSLCLALLHDPQVIFLDEPTLGLDINGRNYLWQRIKQLKKEGKTLIIATNLLQEAEELCDRVILINQGEIVLQGKPDELKEKFNTDNLEKVFIDITGGNINEN